MALDEHVPRRLRSDGNAKDVFCMVKASMSDDHLIQPPLLVYPDCFLQTTQHFINRINSTDELLSPCLEQARRDELSALADHIQQDFSHLQRAVQYLKALAGEDRARQPCQGLKFIEAGPSASSGLGDLRLGPRPLPPKPRKLQVVFHHRANR